MVFGEGEVGVDRECSENDQDPVESRRQDLEGGGCRVREVEVSDDVKEPVRVTECGD